MPYLHLRLTGDARPEIGSQLAERLTDLSTRLLHKRREVTALTIEEIAADRWWIGGEPVGQRTAFLEIRITQGTNTKEEKARFVEQAFAALNELAGPLHPASYLVVHELPADAWGYAGRTQEERYIRSRLENP